MSLHSDAVALRTAKLIAGVSVLALTWGVAGAAFAAVADDDQAQTVDEVLVTGQRLGTANAISAQRRADGVVNVLSADDMGKLPDANVADALARLPGINVIVNQDTGEGEYVTVRGFAGTFNAYSINGVRVALTDTDSRQMSMTVLPPNGLQAITVSKTLTPDMDGDAIGGSIDFRTPNAFDFKGPVARMFASYGANDRARDQGEASDNYLVQADFGRRLKDDRFGVFASVNYGRSHGVTEETENDGEWEPYIWRKNGEEAVDERSMYLPGIDLDYRRNEQKRYGGNLSLDYRGVDHDLYLRGQYNRFERVSTNDWTDYRSRPSLRLVQVNDEDRSLSAPEKMIIGYDPVLGAIYGYTPGQIVDADGDGRITDADRTRNSYWSLHGRSGVWDPQRFQFSRNMDI
uniref:TonB-dependent receptor plug domain-containing protein n=1 Tax=Brevundimonas nasdae TaxID=172043 RepID=UPI00289C5C9C